MEDLAKHFSIRLKNTTNPGLTLAKFYCTAVNTSLTKEVIITFQRLNTMYGRDIVFKAVLEAYDIEELRDKDDAYGILAYLCRRILNPTKKKKVEVSLTNLVNENLLRVQELKQNKPNIPDPFKENASE